MDYIAASGVAQGFNRGVQNLIRIKQAGMALKQEQEKFDIDKKVSLLQLKKYEQDLDPEIYDLKKRALGLQAKSAELDFEEKNMAVKEAKKRAEWTVDGIFNEIIRAREKGVNAQWDSKGMSYGTKQDVGFNELRARESALKLSTNEMGVTDETMFDKNYRLLSGDRLGSAEPTTTGTVKMIGPDGQPYNIPSQNVEKAKARGFK